jgi:hypothetical protein
MEFPLVVMEATMTLRQAPFLCSLCNDPVDLRTAKTDEYGKTIHEECYVLRVRMKRDMLRSSENPSIEAN